MTARQGYVDASGNLQSVFGKGDIAITGAGFVVDVPDEWPNAWAWDVAAQAFVPRTMTGDLPDLSDA